MSDWCNTDTGEAVYRSLDAVKNLQIKVHLERVTTTAALSLRLQQEVLTQQDGGAIELKPLTSQAQTGDNEEEIVVGWQEKLFSQYEMELFQNEAACQTPLDRQYHKEVTALNRAKGRQNNRIFTYTDYDRYTNCHQLQQQSTTDLLTTTKSRPTFLAERMASMRHRRQDRRTMDLSFPKSKIINWEPSEEFKRSSHEVNSVMQTMHIMGDLGAPGRLGQKENECLLFTVKTDGTGTIVVKPDFNKGKEPYRVVTEGTNKEVWRLTVENVSATMKSEDKEREKHLFKDLLVKHKDFSNSLVGQDFEMPPAGILRYLMNGEIVSAKGFEYDNIYVHYIMELPNKSLPHWPLLYFKVLSLDAWQRCRTEGYGYLLFPDTPGRHTLTCHTWRPLQTGTVSAMRRFFIGGSPELEDPSYVRMPGHFKGERLSRFGFCTESSGSVTFNLHCIQQSKAFVDSSTLRRRKHYVADHTHGFSHHDTLMSTMEAFQRARRKMQDVRESLPRDFIASASQLQI
ncbi:tectonic-like complex member MKS1 isoform X4 [Nerophis lumbriciformis]|uniref:tectonic-like complex member MKS1 isoform X4 n=1 Tax=Nerophis lumbriciformis TaxID=546530 RepID=UPI002ADFCF35|nr:tectonic-like complex member MKS1 isoform X4 [Nerophis lumbriciformis]